MTNEAAKHGPLRPAAVMTAREAEISETDIEELLCQYPRVLALGPLEIVNSQIHQEHGGILDILAFQSDTNTYYEVEITRGMVDHWHLAHVLDYWARELKSRHYSHHMAVLVAESVRGRFRNVLETLPEFIPLIIEELWVLVRSGTGRKEILCQPVYYPDSIRTDREDSLARRSKIRSPLVSRTGLLLIRHFVHNPKLVSAPYREIQKKTDVSLGAISNILGALQDRGLVRIEGRRRYLVDQDALEHHLSDAFRALPERREFVDSKLASIASPESDSGTGLKSPDSG